MCCPKKLASNPSPAAHDLGVLQSFTPHPGVGVSSALLYELSVQFSSVPLLSRVQLHEL